MRTKCDSSKKSSSKQLKFVSCDLKKGHTINYISGGSRDLRPCFFNCNFLLFSSSANHSKKYLAKFGDIQNMKVEKVLHTHPFHNGRQLWQFLTIFLKFHFWFFFFPERKKKKKQGICDRMFLKNLFYFTRWRKFLTKNKIKITGLRIV